MAFNIIRCGLCGKWPLLSPKYVQFINNLYSDLHPLLKITLCNRCYDKGMTDQKWLRSEIKKHYVIVDKEKENDDLWRKMR